MADLNEVIDLRSCSDAGLANGGAVDAGVGLNFNGILENRLSRLNDLVPSPVGLAGEAETVGSDDGSILENDIVTQPTVFTDNRVGVGEAGCGPRWSGDKRRREAG